MAKKNDVENKVDEARKNHEEMVTWKAYSDSLYVVKFVKPLLDIGFSHEQAMSIYANATAIELSQYLKEIDIDIARINAKIPEEPCDCDVCRSKREEEEL